MSLKKIRLGCCLIISVISCKKDRVQDFSILSDVEKTECAKNYHEISNYFLQPSELYRTFKDSALIVQPGNVDYRQRLSYSYKKVGEHIKAMKVLNKAVEIDIANGKPDVLQYRAWTLLYYYKDYEGTVKDVNLIEEITGNAYNTCWGEPCGFHKGQALYKLKKYKDAIDALNLVNTEEEKLGFDTKDNYKIFFYIGRCYAELEAYDKAIENYQKALTSVDKFPEAYYQLGLVYKTLGETSLARINLELAHKFLIYSINEPYVERLDELFLYRIEDALNDIN
jgi:tetratricopeptide (TPR) repeat protein